MIKIEGLNELTETMDQVSKFASELDGELAHVSFDPNDPLSIEAAIQELNDAVDAKAKGYEGNDWVTEIAETLKENGRAQILEKAAAARLEGDSE